MPRLNWYLHRLLAMSPSEVVLRLRKRAREFADSHRVTDWSSIKLATNTEFPFLPDREAIPEDLLEALKLDAVRIQAGQWKAFGHLKIQVDDPPRWHHDYHADVDVTSDQPASKLNHRELPKGADIKLVWELSRWQQITRLALAAHYLEDADAGSKCVEWLQDWVRNNPPFKGWNWTSALEAGMRLIQFVWIDALLAPHAEEWGLQPELETLRYEIAPSHFNFAWRHRSFGSSANNHLIGELSGLLAAIVRWPKLAIWGAGIDELQGFWETEVINQFAPDGSNCEQALNYQLFSWELSAVAWLAISSKHRPVSARVEERLRNAVSFYITIQREQECWAYGDSDDATVLPFWFDAKDAAWEWRRWMAHGADGCLGVFWDGLRKGISIPKRVEAMEIVERHSEGDDHGWYQFSHAGMAIRQERDWFMRFDLSPLGYKSTCAHGHLDVLHLSIWWRGKAIVVDPGTGAYFGDSKLRNWLASRAAHNGPALSHHEFPKRLGPFLWSAQHSVPAWRHPDPDALQAEWFVPAGTICRKVQDLGDGWRITDDFLPNSSAKDGEFTVRWQFAPGAEITRVKDRSFRVERDGVIVYVLASDDWETVIAEEPSAENANRGEFECVVSARFRLTERAPCLLLTAQAGYKPCVFSTTFLASAPG